jgi:DNA-binding NarL/FixJ family response regulator
MELSFKFCSMIRVVLYEDNNQLREGLAMLINGSDGFSVVNTYRNCNHVEEDIKADNPDIVLMDIDMPGVDGIKGLKLIRQLNTTCKVLMLTVFDDKKNVFEAIRAGADGYLLKKTQPAKLIEHLKDVYEGGSPMTASIARQVILMFNEYHETGDNKKGEEYNLTDREKEVLQLMVKGYTYKMAATELFIAVETIRSHIKNIYEKLHVNSKTEAVAKVFKDNLL